jgi:outer membrane protein assembly factor BamB
MSILMAALLCLTDAAPIGPPSAEDRAPVGPVLPQMPVEVILYPPPEGRLFVQDLWRIELINTYPQSFTVYMHLTVAKEGEGLIMEATTSEFGLPPGAIVVAEADISPIETTFYYPEYEDILLQAGSFPSGTYVVSIQVFEAGGGLLGEGGFQQGSENLSPPVLVHPRQGAAISGEIPVFTWLPPTPALPQGWGYRLTVSDVVEGQSAQEALEANPPRIATGLQETMLAWPLEAASPVAGSRYAWRVELVASDGSVHSSSEARTFTYAGGPAGTEPGSVVWTTAAGPEATAGVVLGRALSASVGGADGRVRCFDAGGRDAWVWRGPGRVAQLAVLDGLTMVMGAGGVTVLDGSGVPVWEIRDRGRCIGGALCDTLAVLAWSDGTLLGVDPEDGGTVWETVLEGGRPTAPCLDGRLAVCVGSELVMLDPTDGSVLRTVELDADPTAPPSAAPGEGVLVPCGNSLEMVRPGGGWTADLGSPAWREAVLGPGGTVLVATEGMNVCMVDSGRGHVLRRLRAGAPVTAPPAAGSDGRIYVGCGDGTVRCFGPLGEREWVADAGSPVTAAIQICRDGTVLAATLEGTVVKIACASTSAAPSGWPSGGGGPDGSRRGKR